jgi:hypothetical protein
MSNEITLATDAELEEFFAEAPAAIGDGRLIFGLDATGSREATWDTAARIQIDMFKAAGHGLRIKLIYFRGGDECKATPWIASPQRLGDMMRTISCLTGETQIGKVLSQASHEKISALVYVGDCCEEDGDELCAKARKLNAPVFIFQEGDDEHAENIFRQIAKITKGGFRKFEAGAGDELAKLLKAVAKFAVGGMAALDAAQIKLIGHG